MGASALMNLIWVFAWSQLGQLGLQQSVIARVVHQTKMILKFGVESDGQDSLGE